MDYILCDCYTIYKLFQHTVATTTMAMMLFKIGMPVFETVVCLDFIILNGFVLTVTV